MEKTVKFGIIGAGNIANKFCDAVSLTEGAEVVAVSSKSLERAKDFAQNNGIERYYDNYEEMLKSADIDVVYIATTHNFHYENAMLCLDYNKAILCEKAMVLNAAHAKGIFERAKKQNVFVMEAMWSRFLPHIQMAKNWLKEGRIGRADLATYSMGFSATEDPESRLFNPYLAGGAAFDIGVYAIELMTFMIDEPVREVKAMISLADTGVDKVDNITLRFDSCIANLQASLTSVVCENLFVFGTDGYIQVPKANYSNECFLYDKNGLVEHFKVDYQNGFTYQVEEVVRCIREGKIESEIMPHSATIECAEIFDICFAEGKSKN